MLYKVILPSASVDKILKCDHSIESNGAVLSCGAVELHVYCTRWFVLTFDSVDEILKRHHSNESYGAVLSFGTVYYAIQGGSNFGVC